MLLTRSLPPQFLLPAWSTRQLTQAVQKAQLSDYNNRRALDADTAAAGDGHARDNESDTSSKPVVRSVPTGGDYPRNMATYKDEQRRQFERAEDKTGFKPAIQYVATRRDFRHDSRRAATHKNEQRKKQRERLGQITGFKKPKESSGQLGVLRIRPASAEYEAWRESREPQTLEGHAVVSERDREYRRLKSLARESGSWVRPAELEAALPPQPVQHQWDTGLKLPKQGEGELRARAEHQEQEQEKLRADDTSAAPLSLFEELFPEEALARQTREKKALERLEKLPAFNWSSDFQRGNEYEREQERERERRTESYRSIPARPNAPAKNSLHTPRTQQVQNMRMDVSGNCKVSVLCLKSCSKTLEESDFFRVGSKGDHVENWTKGIVKVIPARDNNTLEPLGMYFLLFSSKAAARAYLDRTISLVELVRSNEFTRHHRAVKIEEDADAIQRNFTLVPTAGHLSLRLLEPPFNPGLQWMINVGGPAALVARQSKTQDIVLLTTDRGYIKPFELATAIAEDGKRRHLHWKLAGSARGGAITKLEPNALAKKNDNSEDVVANHRVSSTYRGPARYTISFKDSNEARRFVREWHRRPFPQLRQQLGEPGDEAPPIIHAEVLW